jgi:hypothetical protein
MLKDIIKVTMALNSTNSVAGRCGKYLTIRFIAAKNNTEISIICMPFLLFLDRLEWGFVMASGSND